jgi:hypothetical protein
MTDYNTYQEKFPFLTGISYRDNEYVGIVVNYDNSMISFYDISMLSTAEEKKAILECGDTWWWGSNRQIPADIYLFKEMQVFKPVLKTFVLKEVEIQFGPVTSLQNLSKKRIKRRTVQLIIDPR